jgi:hypothetical protein
MQDERTMTPPTDELNEYGRYDVAHTYVHLDDHVHGLVYQPVEETPRSHITIVIMHPYADNIDHFGTALAGYGYRVMGTDALASRAGTERGQFHLHDSLSDLGSAHQFVRDETDADIVLQLSHSAGPQLAALYQNVAENGVGVGQDDQKIYPLPDHLTAERFPPADGLLLLDPHLGDAPKGLMDLGPQVVDEDDPQQRRQNVDMVDPANGYEPDPDLPSSYDESFLERFYDAQAERHDSLVTRNLAALRAIRNGEGRFPDDDSFTLIDIGTRVYRTDPTILSRTKGEWPLLHAPDSERSDAERTTERVQSVRPPLRNDYEPPMPYTATIGHNPVLETTVRKFLSTRAIRSTSEYELTENSVEGIEWNSSNAQVPGNLETVSSPLLLTAMTGHYFVVQSEIMWNHADSSDKTLLFIDGATHKARPLRPEYGDTRRTTYEAIDRWISDRFV